jgi:hypothetical protein
MTDILKVNRNYLGVSDFKIRIKKLSIDVLQIKTINILEFAKKTNVFF